MNPMNEATAWGTPPAPPAKAAGAKTALLIGLGCLGLLFGLVLLVGGIFAVTTVAMRSSDAYQQALAAAQSDPSVSAALGTPIKPGIFTTGEVRAAGPSGTATLSIPISGPRGTGKIDVRAEKVAGKWVFSRLSVRVPGRPAPLDLLAPPALAP